jgi:hypothetical protein
LTIAQNLLKVMDDGAIAQITGLAVDEAHELRNL